MAAILIIEDDEATASQIAWELEERGFEIRCVSDGIEGLRLALTGEFDLITLDRMLPGLDGLAIASALKERGVGAPILMITALNEVDERISGLRAGGDDYLTKPFALGEMAARVEVLLRRLKTDTTKLVLRIGDLELDLVSHIAKRAGRDLRLYPKEVKLLEMFMRNSGQVLTRSLIFETVWGFTFDPGTNLIDVHVRALRKKLDAPGMTCPLQTVRGSGYRFSADP